uniref:Uncharacterized protein n=1 Tax=Arundo donax TaxID=35708 RepID=A0A0A9A7E3_ARUDO
MVPSFFDRIMSHLSNCSVTDAKLSTQVGALMGIAIRVESASLL